MRILALDIGERRVGVAVSDDTGRVAVPLEVLDADAMRGDFREVVELVARVRADLVVVGLPLSLDGTEGPQAVKVRAVVDRMARFLPVEVEYADERLSSAAARDSARRSGVGERALRGKLDAAAAAVFLQTWLDARSRAGSDE